MVIILFIARIRINRVRLYQSCSWSAEQGKYFFPWSRSRLRIWSREAGSAIPSRVSLLISILRINLVLTYGIPPEFRIRHRVSPEFIGSHAIAYRWRSLPKVHQHRAASKPRGSSNRVLPWQRSPWAIFLCAASLCPHPLLVCNGHVCVIQK